MIGFPKLAKLKNGHFVYKYEDGSVSEEYKTATEYDEQGNARVTTLKDKDFLIDKYGNHINDLVDWYDILKDKPQEFLYIQTELFANKNFIKTLIKVVKSDIEYKHNRKYNTVLFDPTQPQKDLDKFDKVIKEKYAKEAENLKDYIQTLTDWQKELGDCNREQEDEENGLK